ncbi:LysE family translocator [Microbacterium sp. NPDC056052]|uniref:LysE family translocator n=1 Tax=Microbacterium sp. NPDC056052 TaxID=3345695 RepID=UPI0035D6EC4E
MDTSFLVTSIVITATPGSGVLFTIAAGLSRGVRAGIIAAIGCTLGILPHLALALSGAAAVMAASSVLFDVIRWVGVAYLLFMAWGMWRDERGLVATAETEDGSAAPGMSFGRVIRDAVLVNLLNPKLTIFFFVFLPMFVDVEASDGVLRMAALARRSWGSPW